MKLLVRANTNRDNLWFMVQGEWFKAIMVYGNYGSWFRVNGSRFMVNSGSWLILVHGSRLMVHEWLAR